jgi:hypothetical protein
MRGVVFELAHVLLILSSSSRASTIGCLPYYGRYLIKLALKMQVKPHANQGATTIPTTKQRVCILFHPNQRAHFCTSTSFFDRDPVIFVQHFGNTKMPNYLVGLRLTNKITQMVWLLL